MDDDPYDGGPKSADYVDRLTEQAEARRYPLATRDGIRDLITVIALQDVWRSLTKVQRVTLTYPDQPVNSPATVRALTSKGLWGADGVTELGRAVAEVHP